MERDSKSKSGKHGNGIDWKGVIFVIGGFFIITVTCIVGMKTGHVGKPPASAAAPVMIDPSVDLGSIAKEIKVLFHEFEAEDGMVIMVLTPTPGKNEADAEAPTPDRAATETAVPSATTATTGPPPSARTR